MRVRVRVRAARDAVAAHGVLDARGRPLLQLEDGDLDQVDDDEPREVVRLVGVRGGLRDRGRDRDWDRVRPSPW